MAIVEVCPACGHRFAPDAAICTNCGYDRRLAQRAGRRAGDLAQAVRSRLSPGVVAWMFGLALAALLVGSFVAALRADRFVPWYIGVIACYFVAAWVVGVILDYRQKGLFGALMWFSPFLGRYRSHFMTVAIVHETVAPRRHHGRALLEALFINAVLALVSLPVFWGIQIALG